MEDRHHPGNNFPHQILRCPMTRGAVRELSSRELADMNHRIQRRQLFHYDGSPVQIPLQRGLRSIDGPYVYRIDDGILAMLVPLAIVWDTNPVAVGDMQTPHKRLREDKRAVQQFYNDVGWRQEDGHFLDAMKWEDLRPVAADYVSKCHLRINEHLQPRGGYLLDVACGPVQYPEYLSYAEGYTARICVDISVAALRAAQRNVGPRGIYILGDITNLPLANDAVQGVVCLHTIYHVPADEQVNAFHEVHRVLAPGHNAVVVYAWRSLAIKVVSLPASAIRRVGKAVRKIAALAAARSARKKHPEPYGTTPARLYFHAYSYRWFARQRWGFSWQIRPWRSVTVAMMKSYFHRRLMGRRLLALLFRLEQLFPRLLGKHGAYGMIVIHKQAPGAGAQDNPSVQPRRAA